MQTTKRRKCKLQNDVINSSSRLINQVAIKSGDYGIHMSKTVINYFYRATVHDQTRE